MKCHLCSSVKMWFGKLIRFIAREWSIEREVPRAPAPLSVVRDRPIKIVFVVEYAEAWGSYESVYHAFNADENCEVAVVAIAESSSYQGIKNKPRDFLAAAGIPFYSSDCYDLTVHRPDVVFFHRPYEYFRPREWQVTGVERYTSRIAYICYGFEVGGGRVSTQFDQPMHLHAWRIFVYSPLIKKLFARNCEKGDGHVVAAGHPMVDAVLSFRERDLDQEIKKRVGGRRTVLWCPHYSASNEGEDMSTFCLWGESIISEFEQRDDMFLIVRPHPLLFSHLKKNGVMSDPDLVRLQERIGKAANMLLDESSDFRQSFYLSHGMIADGGTFVMLYPSTGKPVLYLKNPDGKGLNEAGEVTKLFYQCESRADITGFIDLVASGDDHRKSSRMEGYRQVVLMPEQGAGPKIKQHVLDAVKRGV